MFINEFLADNSGRPAASVYDAEGGSPDWIELHNSGESEVDLAGWALTDSAKTPAKWRFPAARLGAHAYCQDG